ncbi:MAG: hypothetical protein IKT41_01100 [Clostridia bacterium]|nr:hypothetical protein [Clostridia bacterium]
MKTIKNIEIKSKINELNASTQEILDVLLSDSIIEMNCRNRIDEDILKRIVLVYLSLFDDNEYLEYDELNVVEKNIICRIISKGIASIYVDDEYITNDNSMDKLVIIEDMIALLCFLTDFNRSTIKRLIIRDIKIYFYHGWKWDFI